MAWKVCVTQKDGSRHDHRGQLATCICSRPVRLLAYKVTHEMRSINQIRLAPFISSIVFGCRFCLGSSSFALNVDVAESLDAAGQHVAAGLCQIAAAADDSSEEISGVIVVLVVVVV